jgi:hypothetical protein
VESKGTGSRRKVRQAGGASNKHGEMPRREVERGAASPGIEGAAFKRAARTLSFMPLVTGLLRDGRRVVLDVRGRLDRATQPAGVELWRL